MKIVKEIDKLKEKEREAERVFSTVSEKNMPVKALAPTQQVFSLTPFIHLSFQIPEGANSSRIEVEVGVEVEV